jgi:O-antigen ligase
MSREVFSIQAGIVGDMTRLLVFAYIFFASWNGVFAISEWVRVPFLFMLGAVAAAFLVALNKKRVVVSVYKKEDMLLPMFILVYAMSAIVNMNESGLNYVLAYIFVLFGLYLAIKWILYTFAKPWQFHFANTVGVVLLGCFLSVNFILTVTGVVNLQDLFPRLSKDATAVYDIGDTLLNRGYGFSTEPGVVAFYLNVLGPIALWFLWHETKLATMIKVVMTLLVAFGWLITFSASGWVFLFLSYVIALFTTNFRLSKKNFRASRLIKAGAMFGLFSVLLVALGSQPIIQDYARSIVMKLTLSDGLKTVDHRTERLDVGLDMAFEKPLLGYGPRYFSSQGESSTLNWYLMLVVEGGWICFLIVMLFLVLVFVRISKSSLPNKFPFLVGFIAGCGHLAVISTFYHPFLWLLIAIFYAQDQHHKNQLVLNRKVLSGM